jgi:hypothetical protein
MHPVDRAISAQTPFAVLPLSGEMPVYGGGTMSAFVEVTSWWRTLLHWPGFAAKRKVRQRGRAIEERADDLQERLEADAW